MWAALLPLISGIFGSDGVITQYFKTKADIRQKEQDFKLALLESDIRKATQERQSDSEDVKNRLNATSEGFKQSTWYFFAALIVFSVLFPSKATVMWQNLNIVPDWVQNTFVAMTLVTWGINPVKNGISWFKETAGEALQSRREYKIEREKIKRDVVFASIKEKWFPRGMNKQQVEDLDKALDAGEKD